MVENNVTNDLKQFIVVKIDNEQYGIDIGYVDNIVRMQRITRVPKAQSYFEGVINLRGEVIPVMSMRKKFGLDADVVTGKTRIIILKAEQQGSFGVQVDEVKEVVTLSDEQMEKTGYDKKQEDGNNFLMGIGKHDDDLISLLNISALISENE